MRYVITTILSVIVFNLFIGYLLWDFTWFTELSEYSTKQRVDVALGMIGTMFISNMMSATYTYNH